MSDTPILGRAELREDVYVANADGNPERYSDTSTGSSSGSGSGSTTPRWLGITNGVVDTLTNIYDNIVSPIMNGGGKYSGQVSIESQKKDNTVTYLIVGGVIVVALVLILKFVKK